MNYSDLREVQKKELESSTIVDLPDGFYEQISDLLKEKKQKAMSSESILAIKEYENIKKIVSSIASKREEKIVLMAIREETDTDPLTNEEKEMLKKINNVVQNSREKVKSAWSLNNKVNEDSEPEPEPKSEEIEVKVKILEEIEEYKGLDDSVYGPFSEGQKVSIPSQEAEWLLEEGMAKRLNKKESN